MKRILGLGLLGLACLALATCEQRQRTTAGPAFQKLSLTEALAEAVKQNKLVMIDFSASWCGPCHKMEDETFGDPHVQIFLREHTIAIQVDVDKQKKIVSKFGIAAMPTIVFLDAKGEELDRSQGFLDADTFLQRFAHFAK